MTARERISDALARAVSARRPRRGHGASPATPASALSPASVAGRAAAPVIGTWGQLARRRPDPARFDPALTAGLPEPARRWLIHAIAPGTPLARAAIVQMEGHIRIGRWVRFRAGQLHAPPDGYVWAARAALGPLWISGFDCYAGTAGRMAGACSARSRS